MATINQLVRKPRAKKIEKTMYPHWKRARKEEVFARGCTPRRQRSLILRCGKLPGCV